MRFFKYFFRIFCFKKRYLNKHILMVFSKIKYSVHFFQNERCISFL